MTLIEVVIVLAVIGVLFAVAAPQLNRFIQASRFDQGVKVFQQGLTTARDAASTQSKPVRFEASGGSVTWTDATANVQMGSSTLPFGTTVAAGAPTVLFSGRGLPEVQAVFGLQRGGLTATVYLLPTGAIIR